MSAMGALETCTFHTFRLHLYHSLLSIGTERGQEPREPLYHQESGSLPALR